MTQKLYELFLAIFPQSKQPTPTPLIKATVYTQLLGFGGREELDVLEAGFWLKWGN